jgi:ferritin heavy chain
MSLSRLNLSNASVDAINRQIAMEQTASQTYLSMSTWLSRDTVALPGLAQRFRKLSEEEAGHAKKLIDYLTMRGGVVVISALPAPEVEWKSAINILETALQMEKDVTISLMEIAKTASQSEDHELEDYITSEFLREQTKDIKEAADLVTQLRMAGTTGLGLFLFDRALL